MRLFAATNKVIVRPKETDGWVSGLYLPEIAQEKTNHGKVLAVGPRVHDVQVDDTVYYNPATTTDISVDGTRLVIFPEPDAIARIGWPAGWDG